jgi:hypothetical protein
MPPLFPPFVSQQSVPSDRGLNGWTWDNKMNQAATIIPTAGVLHLIRLRVFATLVTNVHLHITTPGGTLTAGQNFAALYSAAGARLSVSADQSTFWQSGGAQNMPLAVAQATTFGAYYYVGLFSNGTTQPTFTRALNSSSAITNFGLSAPNFDHCTADTGLTTTMPATFGAQTGTLTAYWAATS